MAEHPDDPKDFWENIWTDPTVEHGGGSMVSSTGFWSKTHQQLFLWFADEQHKDSGLA